MLNNAFYYEKHSDNSKHSFFTHSYGGPCIPHFHMAIEIVGVVKGQLEVIVNNVSHTLRQGDIAVIPSAAVHTFKCSKNNEDYVMNISQNMLAHFKKEYPKDFDFFLPKGPYTKKLFDAFLTIENNWQDADYLTKYGLVNFFLGLLAKAYPPNKEFTKKDFIYADILTYIEDNLFKPLSLEMIANHFGYSKNYFSYTFNKAMGMNLKNYINRLRLQKAIAKINSPENKETVLKVAMDCGFNSLNTFYRALKLFKGEDNEQSPILEDV